ncbi:transmembrane protein 168-like [Corythoichthys intestinalis]|uniref:transmembrane protein 168-like n=1 Tax=Corythoichthys intestinalis TaxID=161448 RepID=UPI0025A67207|nr:transmembrane protein 168-like [Corythoichthys intestinalis]XP_061813344.1 transmembrane protein 168-like [Nerophis lumbriciformis]
MVRLVRYCVSHLLRATMSQFEGEGSLWSAVRCLGYMSGLNLLVALCLGLFVRWEMTAESTLLAIFILALVILVVAAVLYCYCGKEQLSLSLLHLWFGFLLGLLCFVNSPDLDGDVKEQVANGLLLSSLSLRLLWALLERMLGYARYRPGFLTSAEKLQLTGFAAASTVLLLWKALSVTVLALALGGVVVALRMKAVLALINLACFATITADVVFRSLQIRTNPFALGCFFCLVLCDPLLDISFSGLSVTERWQPLLHQRGLWRRLSLLPLLLLELTFLVLAAQVLGHSGRLYLSVPAFVTCALFWAICHLVFFISLWGFHSKLNDCQRVCLIQGCGTSRLDKIMASKGMRHFCLISERLLRFTLASTVALAALSWQASSGIFLCTFLLVLPLESIFHGLFHELGSTLGGTCVGYGVVIPTNYCSPDGQPVLLPPEQVQQLNLRSTAMLSNIQRFLAQHLIETYGCDYSTGGVTLEALQAKLKAFMELRTADGPRYDTYVLFYSGHTHRTGEWALAGGDTLSLDQLLDWWREKNGTFRSRLILVLDCDHSLPTVKAARRVEGVHVAVQGAAPSRMAERHPGDFLSHWVAYNCDGDSGVPWARRTGAPAAIYGVSSHWSDYEPHLPAGGELADHWRAYFPRVAHPVVRAALWCGGLSLLWPCGACLRCMKRFKLNYFPPTVLDTGQGFKLVRS